MSAPKKFRGYQITVEDWLALCEMHGNRCAQCGEEKPLSVDHIKPRWLGGTDDISNIQPLCKSCNSSKGSKFDGQSAKKKTKTSSETFRFTETASNLIQACADAAGVSKAAILEQAIRDYARKNKVTLPSPENAVPVAPAMSPAS